MIDSAMKRSALIVATSGVFLTPFMGSAINVALPSIQKEFQMNAVFLSWIAAAHLMAAAVSPVPFGRLTDIYGRKKIFSAGAMLFAACHSAQSGPYVEDRANRFGIRLQIDCNVAQR